MNTFYLQNNRTSGTGLWTCSRLKQRPRSLESDKGVTTVTQEWNRSKLTVNCSQSGAPCRCCLVGWRQSGERWISAKLQQQLAKDLRAVETPVTKNTIRVFIQVVPSLRAHPVNEVLVRACPLQPDAELLTCLTGPHSSQFQSLYEMVITFAQRSTGNRVVCLRDSTVAVI